MECSIIKVNNIITPSKMIFKRELKRITYVFPELIINGYSIYINRNKLYKLCLENIHPNCDQKTKIFCLPDCILGKELNKEIFKIIDDILCTYNLDSCYYIPWKYFRYE